MKHLTIITALLITASSMSCYHATVNTNLAPSSKVVEKSFAAGWILGLVPPKTIKAAVECENGVAIVETKLSFVNMVVAGITLGIYTPMHITVTCASSSSMGSLDSATSLTVAYDATEEEVQETFALAAQQAVEHGEAVYVQFEEVVEE